MTIPINIDYIAINCYLTTIFPTTTFDFTIFQVPECLKGNPPEPTEEPQKDENVPIGTQSLSFINNKYQEIHLTIQSLPCELKLIIYKEKAFIQLDFYRDRIVKDFMEQGEMSVKNSRRYS